jgi:hypothetical protein
MRILKFQRKQQTFVKVRSATSSLLIKFFEHNNKGRELGPDSSFCNHECERGIDSEPTSLAKRARFLEASCSRAGKKLSTWRPV